MDAFVGVNFVTAHPSSGIALTAPAGSQTGVDVAQNAVVDDAGIDLVGLTASGVSGNVVVRSNDAVIRVGAGTSNVLVSGNVVFDNAGDGILLESATSNLLDKNSSEDNLGSGIRVDSTSTANEIRKSKLDDNAVLDCRDDSA